MFRKSLSILAAASLMALLGPAAAHAQLGKLKAKVKQKVEQKVDEKVDCTLEKYMDNEECQAEAAKAKTTSKAATSKAGAKSSDSDGAEAASLKPGQGAWANFDFVPGARPIFVEDFTRDRVGNFPKRLELQHGTFEVVEWQGKRWLRHSTEAEFSIMLPETLPPRWTMEFDMTIPWDGMFVFPGEAATPGNDPKYENQSIFLSMVSHVTGGGTKITKFDVRDVYSATFFNPENGLTPPVRVRIHQDGKYMKVYLDEKRVANMPNMGAWTGNQLNFLFNPPTKGDEGGALISNISINAGGKDMYDALTADGRLALQGIYFDTGSDRIRPESSGTLLEISEMLNEHADLKLVIEGHTDNVGDAAANQKLSEARAAAVVATLSSQYKVSAERLKSAGFGATRPAKPNDTPEGRQANRRVELVVQK